MICTVRSFQIKFWDPAMEEPEEPIGWPSLPGCNTSMTAPSAPGDEGHVAEAAAVEAMTEGKTQAEAKAKAQAAKGKAKGKAKAKAKVAAVLAAPVKAGGDETYE